MTILNVYPILSTMSPNGEKNSKSKIFVKSKERQIKRKKKIVNVTILKVLGRS